MRCVEGRESAHRLRRKVGHCLILPGLQASIANCAGSLFGDEEYSDLTITCGPHTFRVHKAIVCPRSDYFKAACRKGRFKVSAAAE